MFFIGPQNQRFRLKRGVFLRPNPRKRDFFKRGYGYGTLWSGMVLVEWWWGLGLGMGDGSRDWGWSALLTAHFDTRWLVDANTTVASESTITIHGDLWKRHVASGVQQDRRWNADKPSAALDPHIPTWITTSPANHRPANIWKSFFSHWKEIVKRVAISGWTDEDQLQIWSSHSLILHVQIITYTLSISL